jgi:DNA repair exonuclease SbcCD ATPase subunit
LTTQAIQQDYLNLEKALQSLQSQHSKVDRDIQASKEQMKAVSALALRGSRIPVPSSPSISRNVSPTGSRDGRSRSPTAGTVGSVDTLEQSKKAFDASLCAEAEEKQQAVRLLVKRKAKIEEEMSIISQELERCGEVLHNAEAELFEAQKNVANATLDLVQSVAVGNQDWHVERDQLKRDIHSLTQAKEETSVAYEELKRDYEDTRAQLENTIVELENANQARIHLQEKEVLNVQEALDAAQEKITMYEEKQKDSDRKMQDLETENILIGELNVSITSCHKFELLILTVYFFPHQDKLQEQITKGQQGDNKESAALTAANLRIETLEKQNKYLLQSVSNLETQLEQSKKVAAEQVSHHLNKIGELERENKTLREKNMDHEKQLNDIKSESATANVEAALREQASLQQLVGSLEKQLETSLKVAKEASGISQSKIESLESQNKSLQQALESLEDHLDQRDKTVKHERQLWETEKTGWQERISKLERKLKKREKENLAAHSSTAVLSTSEKSAQPSPSESESSRIHDLELRLKETEHQYQTALQLKQTLESQLQSSQHDVDDLRKELQHHHETRLKDFSERSQMTQKIATLQREIALLHLANANTNANSTAASPSSPAVSLASPLSPNLSNLSSPTSPTSPTTIQNIPSDDDSKSTKSSSSSGFAKKFKLPKLLKKRQKSETAILPVQNPNLATTPTLPSPLQKQHSSTFSIASHLRMSTASTTSIPAPPLATLQILQDPNNSAVPQLQLKIQDLGKENTKLHTTIQSLTTQLLSTETECSQLLSKFVSQQSHIEETDKIWRSRMEELKVELERCETYHRELETELKDQVKELRDHQIEMLQNQHQPSPPLPTSTTNPILNNTCSQCSANLSNISEEHTNTTPTILPDSSARSSVSSQMSSTQDPPETQIQNLKSHLLQTQNNVHTLQRTLFESDIQIETLQSSNKTLHLELSKLQRRYEEELEVQRKMLEAAEGLVERLKGEVKEREREVREVRRASVSMKRDVEVRQGGEEKKADEKKEGDDEGMEGLREGLKKAELKLKEREEELVKLKAELHESLAESTETVSNTKRKRRSLNYILTAVPVNLLLRFFRFGLKKNSKLQLLLSEKSKADQLLQSAQLKLRNLECENKTLQSNLVSLSAHVNFTECHNSHGIR